MAGKKVFASGGVLCEVVRSFALSEEINQLLIASLASRARLAKQHLSQVSEVRPLGFAQGRLWAPGGLRNTFCRLIRPFRHT